MPVTEQNSIPCKTCPSSHITIKNTITHLVAQVINLSTVQFFPSLSCCLYLLHTGQINFFPPCPSLLLYFNLSFFNYVDFNSSVSVFKVCFCTKHMSIKQATPSGRSPIVWRAAKSINNIYHQKQHPRISPHSTVGRLPRKNEHFAYTETKQDQLQ